jgi:hypothetical protein
VGWHGGEDVEADKARSEVLLLGFEKWLLRFDEGCDRIVAAWPKEARRDTAAS